MLLAKSQGDEKENDVSDISAATYNDDKTPEESESTGRARMDPEIKDMAAIMRILEGMTLKARIRCVAWLKDRYSGDVF